MKWIFFFGCLLLASCHQYAPVDQSTPLPAIPTSLTQRSNLTAGDLAVDTRASIIGWKGTKFWGMGKHEGILRLSDGHLTVENGSITAGSFVIDMQTIEVTDIPKSDPVPRKRLRNHLMDDDFFAVATYPTAHFTLTRVQRHEEIYRVTGNLTLRGQTHPVTFEAIFFQLTNTTVEARAQFNIDRQKWGVAYRGSRLTNDLVDDDIQLDLVLVATTKP